MRIGFIILAEQFAHTIIPWILGGLAILVAISAMLTIRFWRESKRSPYYFLRRQAEQNMQTYSLATLGLFVTSLFVGTYAWQGPQEYVSRVVLMSSAKPVINLTQGEQGSFVAEEALAEEDSQSQIVVIGGRSHSEILLSLATQQGDELPQIESNASELASPTLDQFAADSSAAVQAIPTLPTEFDQFEPEVQLSDETDIGALSFSTDVDDNLTALNPRRLFTEGYFMLYATFDYVGMADGMEWAWIWRRDGEVISGGNELWVYGDEGPGYVYLNPQEGFQPGQYTVEVWVNGQLMSQSNLFVTTDVAANN